MTSRRRVGVNVVPIVDSRRALLRALRGGESVGLVADRDLTHTGIDVPFFGHPAPIPAGPALLAVETGRPIYVGSVRRIAARPLPRPPVPRADARDGDAAREDRRPHDGDRGRLRVAAGRRPRAVVGRVPPDLAGPRPVRADVRCGGRGRCRPARRPPRDRRPHRAARPRRPPHPHARVGRDGVGRRDPGPRGARGRARRDRDHRPRAHRRRPGGPPHGRGWWHARAGGGGRGDQHPRRPPARAVPGAARAQAAQPALVVAAVHEQGGHRHPGPPARPVPAVRPGVRAPRAARRPRPGGASGRDRDVQPHRARPLLARAGRPLRRGPRPVPDRQQRRPRGRRRGIGLDELPGPDRRRRPRRDPRGHHGPSRRLPRHRRPARDVRPPAAQVRPRRAGRGRRAGCAATARAATTAIRAGTTGRRASSPRTRSGTRDEDRPRLAVRVPAPGRRDPARPLPVREPAPARPRRPDPDLVPRAPARLRGRRHPPRQGLLDAGQRLRRDHHALAPLHLAGAGRARPRAVRRPPLPRAVRAVPLARAAARVEEREHRDVPRLRRLVARPTSSAAGRCGPTRTGSTAGSRSRRRRATSSTATSRATTRSSPTASTSSGSAGPSRWPAGRTAPPNILFVGRFEPRKGVLDLLKAYRILRKTGCDCRLLLVGGGPQEREARRYIATRRLHGVEFLGRVSDDEKAQLFRTADVYVSPATGRESFGIVLLEAMAAGAPIVASDIHGYKGVVRRDREALLVPPRQPKAIASSIAPAPGRARHGGGDVGRRDRAGRGVQLAARDRQGRGVLRVRDPPAGRLGAAAGALHGLGAPVATPARHPRRHRRRRLRRARRPDAAPATEPAPEPA